MLNRKYFLLLVLSALCCSYGIAQQSNSWRARVDDMIEQTDSLSMKTQTTFYLVKYLKHDRTIKETWYYTLKEGKPVFFQLHYAIDSNEYTESYYLNKNKLICMAQVEQPYSDKTDDINHAEIFFFLDDNLRQYVTSGSSKLYTSRFERQIHCLDQFTQRFTELRANLR